jgi:2-phospho-L-lactate guanylyltransferase
MKPLSDSKTRLSDRLTPEERANLTIGMLRAVLEAIKGAFVDPVWVVGGDQRVREEAEQGGAHWMEELGNDLNDTLSRAFDLAFGLHRGALYIPGDLPFLKSGDVQSVLDASRRQSNITLVPARRDGGTNAILVPNNVPFRPALGPQSFTRHLAKAAELEISVAICHSPGLGLDLDVPDDLDTSSRIAPGFLERLSVESGQ